MDKISMKENVSLDSLMQTIGYYAKYYSRGLYQGKSVYQLHEKMQSFLMQKFSSAEEQKKAHGNLIWKLKNFYSTPFKKEAVSLINKNVDKFVLSDNDKLAYLNYVLSTKNYGLFSSAFYQKLSLVDLDNKAKREQAMVILSKMKKILDKKYRNKDNYKKNAAHFFPYLRNFSEQTNLSSYNLIKDYSEMFFKISENFPEQYISLHPIYLLTQKTHAALFQKTPTLFEDEYVNNQTPIDKLAVINVAKAYRHYAQNLNKQNKVNHNLAHAMERFLGYVVQHHNYHPKDVKNLSMALGAKYEANGRPNPLYPLKTALQKSYNTHREKNRLAFPLLVRGKKANDII